MIYLKYKEISKLLQINKRTQLIKWTEEQETLYFIVSNLYKKHKSYRKVSALLNQRKIKTFKGNTWAIQVTMFIQFLNDIMNANSK